MTISFDGRVAIVTGADGGLGRAYALALAQRGAKVVVNDLGAARDGIGHSDAALKVVEEIEAAGGEAISDGGSVTDAEQMVAMVARAREKWGGVHILINNAGILRDKSFANMTMEDFRLLVDVHLIGSANATKAVWDVMRDQQYGRILMTSSSSGLYGNFGQASYGAAKLGLVGLARTLHLEGARYNVRCNSIAPVAGTRMTQDIFPPDAFDALTPENVVPAALYLVSEDAPSNAIVGAGAGFYHAVHVTMTQGTLLPEADRTPEGIAANWDRITDRIGEHVPASGPEQAMAILSRLQGR